MSFTHLSDMLLERSRLSNRGVTFIEKGNQEQFLSYKDLYTAALYTLGSLQQRGVSAGDELVMQVEDNRSFIIIFWACILGGIIPVPLTIGQNESHRHKLFTVWQVLNRPWLCIASGNLDKLRVFAEEKQLNELFSAMEKRIIDAANSPSATSPGIPAAVKPGDIAFIQFSSGSTGLSKGVMLTHRNLLSNMNGISKASAYTENDSMLSWMPLTHDMGLIGFHLNPLYSGMNHYLLPPALFVLRPDTWLEKAGEHRVSILCSPNFGYSYLLRHCELAGKNWDLSNVRIIYNGAEPVSEQLCYRFLDACAVFGLKRQAMCPVYGLAEASLAVSISGMQDEVIAIALDRNKLKPGDTIAATAVEQDRVSFVNVGKPIEDCLLRITDTTNTPLPEGTIGLVQVKGGSVTGGYYNNEEETGKCLLPGGWLNTGDLGFCKDGALYITGRAKDIIFVNGQNYYPHDIEAVAEEVEGVELNKIIVAGHFNDLLQKEECIAFVFNRGSLENFCRLATTLKSYIAAKTGLDIHKVIPVTDIPRTTSGKLQRFKLLEHYRQGKFSETEKMLADINAALPSVLNEPATATEEKLLSIWNAVLGTQSRNVEDRFFECGGNSLRAASLSMMIGKEMETELLPVIIYEKQTVRNLAQEIDSREKTVYQSIPLSRVRDRYPLSAAQKGIYHFCRLHPESVCYNIPVAFRAGRPLDMYKLENALQQLVQRHEVLRTRFSSTGEAEIHPHTGCSVQQLFCTEELLLETLQQLVQPFDLQQAPLFRLYVVIVENAAAVLFLDVHHIIADGLSVWKLVSDLLKAYTGNTLSFLPVQYIDYVYWKQDQAASGDHQRQEAYWLQHLRGALPVLELPADYARPPDFRYTGARCSFTIAAATTARLRMLATAQQCTLQELMFTLYTLLLAKYSGQEELITGIAVSGRPHPDLLEVAGMFVNNLAISSRIPACYNFIELLREQTNTIRDALRHQDYPFHDLVAALDGKRDISRHPVFDTMFVYQDMPVTEFADSVLSLTRIELDPGIAKFDLSLELTEEPTQLTGSMEYCSSLFSGQTIRRFITHFQTLIQRVLDAPGSGLQQLSVIPDSEYRAYLQDMNATQKVYAGSETIHGRFEEQVMRTPHHIALEYEGTLISYTELNTRANQLAAVLQQQGVRKESIVALLLERSPELVTGMLAAVKAGGCFLPMDPAWPAERIQYVLNNSRATLLISNEAMLQSGGLTNAALPPVIDAAHISSHTVPLTNHSSGRDTCYIIYTSGTTGYPKGVMIEHASAVNYISWAKEQYLRNDALDFPFYTSVAFDLTITSVFTPLLSGNRVVIYKEAGNTFLLEKVIADNKTGIIKLTPSHLKALPGLLHARQATACSIQRMIVGGEQLDTALAKKIHDLFNGNVEIYNEYGPTEATVGCMIHRYSTTDQGASVPVGIPAANTRIYLLDKQRQPVPVGVYGEMHIAGTGLARGYLYNESLTAEKFLPDPFVPGERMYRTGDIARWLHNGIMEYQGRYDQQTKLNGYRIELSEIQVQVAGYAGIEEAIVTVHTTESHQKLLCAYYTVNPAEQAPVDQLALRNYLAARLPYYMLPAHFIQVNQVPLTANGKVNYDALPSPATGNGQHTGPQSETENAFIAVWQEILGVADISVNDNFYELGGDSIKAIQVASRLLEKGITINVKDILTYHTIRHTSVYAEMNNDAARYTQQEVTGERPLLPVEKWFFAQDFPRPGCYNQSVMLVSKRSLSIPYLQLVMEALIRHHDGLRLNYQPGNQTMFYHPAHTGPVTIDCVPVKELENYTHHFDITSELLFKIVVGKTPGEDDRLLLIAHHLVMDGISWRILLKDLYDWYTVLEQEKELNRLPKTASSLDWYREYSAAAPLPADEKMYWEKMNATAFTIPQDQETADWRSAHLGKCSAGISASATQRLVSGSNKVFRCDAGILINASFALALQQWTGSDSIKIELENHGRHLPAIDVSRTTGWFTIMHPVVIHIPAASTDVQVKAIKEQVKAIPHHGINYGRFIPAQPAAMAEMPAVRFNFLGHFDAELNNDLFTYVRRDIATETDPNNTFTAKLELNALILDGELVLELLYNTRAHESSTINRLLQQVLDYLHDIITYMQQQQEVQFTPSDFNAVALDQDELNSLFQ